jgi:hypothetical protein
MASDTPTPEEVAYFLTYAEGLDKVVVGDYLGERDEMNVKVLAGAPIIALSFRLVLACMYPCGLLWVCSQN